MKINNWVKLFSLSPIMKKYLEASSLCFLIWLILMCVSLNPCWEVSQSREDRSRVLLRICLDFRLSLQVIFIPRELGCVSVSLPVVTTACGSLSLPLLSSDNSVRADFESFSLVRSCAEETANTGLRLEQTVWICDIPWSRLPDLLLSLAPSFSTVIGINKEQSVADLLRCLAPSSSTAGVVAPLLCKNELSNTSFWFGLIGRNIAGSKTLKSGASVSASLLKLLLIIQAN